MTRKGAKFISSRDKNNGYYRKRKEETKVNGKAIKIIGIAASVVGAVATLAGNWAGEKQQDAKIAEKVAEALSKSQEQA